jgi:hypothetical protein
MPIEYWELLALAVSLLLIFLLSVLSGRTRPVAKEEQEENAELPTKAITLENLL